MIAGSLAATASVAALGIAFASRISPSAADRNEYPDAPYTKVAKDYTRIIKVKEAPSPRDPKALERYRDERKAVVRYLREEGAIKKSSPDEREAVRAVYDGNHIRGRELATKVLMSHPASVPALYALARSQFLGEGNLPRALFLIRKVRYILQERGRLHPDDADSREWYLLALDDEHDILTAMDRAAEALRVVELLEQIYEPLPWYKTWRLLKLKRYAEAEACIKATEQSGRWPRTALNDRHVLEERLQRRGGLYQAGLRMTKLIDNSAVHWRNHGGGCLNDFRLEEAEKAFVRATQCGKPNFSGTAYTDLAFLYTQEGRFHEVVDALKHAQAQRATREPSTLQNDQASCERALALLLLALGRLREAEPLARRAHEHQDRTGHTSGDAADEAFMGTYLLWTVLAARIEELRERESMVSWRDRVATAATREELEMESWVLKRQVLKWIVGTGRPNIFRPNMPGTVTPETWLTGSIVQMLPPGVAVELIRQARTEEDHPAAVAYFDAIEAEAALAGGDPREGLRLAKSALIALPPVGEKALRARAAAIGAEAARQLGRRDEWRMLADQVLADFPHMLRLTRMVVPLQIEDDGSPAARLLAQKLSASPRLRSDPAGFAVAIHASTERLSFTMFGSAKARHFEDSVSLDESPDRAASAAFEKFHEHLMAPALDLTQIDINSLDSSPTAIQSRKYVDDILGIVRPKPKPKQELKLKGFDIGIGGEIREPTVADPHSEPYVREGRVPDKFAR